MFIDQNFTNMQMRNYESLGGSKQFSGTLELRELINASKNSEISDVDKKIVNQLIYNFAGYDKNNDKKIDTLELSQAVQLIINQKSYNLEMGDLLGEYFNREDRVNMVPRPVPPFAD